jgi:hypothetical protein
MRYEPPYWKTHNLPKPERKSGFPRVKLKFNKGSNGWIDIDYNEFLRRVEQMKLDAAEMSTMLTDGYEIKLGYCVCILAELIEQTKEKQAGKERKKLESAPDNKKYEVEEIYKQISLF